MGPRSPNGLEQQQEAEARLKARYEEAPMALGPLLAINVAEVIEGKCLKRKAMAREVNITYQVIKHN